MIETKYLHLRRDLQDGMSITDGLTKYKVSLEDASLGAAFLVMAIVGGALMPPLQGMIIDCGTIFGHPAVNVSYALPLLCFVVVAMYGIRSRKNEKILSDTDPNSCVPRW